MWVVAVHGEVIWADIFSDTELLTRYWVKLVRSYAADDVRLAAYLDDRFSSASLPTEEEVRQVGESARARLTAERRQALVSAWIAELRRRTDITILP